MKKTLLIPANSCVVTFCSSLCVCGIMTNIKLQVTVTQTKLYLLKNIIFYFRYPISVKKKIGKEFYTIKKTNVVAERINVASKETESYTTNYSKES